MTKSDLIKHTGSLIEDEKGGYYLIPEGASVHHPDAYLVGKVIGLFNGLIYDFDDLPQPVRTVYGFEIMW